MGLAQDGLDMWKRDRRRDVTQWFRRHGAVAATTVAAQRVGRRSWESTYRNASSAADAVREQVEGLRARNSATQPMADGTQARDDAARASRATGSPAGQSLALAAAVLIDEAETVGGATETVATLDGLSVGLDVYAEAVEHLAETVRMRKGDRHAVKAVANLSGEVAALASEAKKVHKQVSSLYASQVEQEDRTGETLQ